MTATKPRPVTFTPVGQHPKHQVTEANRERAAKLRATRTRVEADVLAYLTHFPGSDAYDIAFATAIPIDLTLKALRELRRSGQVRLNNKPIWSPKK